MNKRTHPTDTLTHINEDELPSMVRIVNKPVAARKAVAIGTVYINAALAAAIRQNAVSKGRVLDVARLAGIQAAKKTSELIPLCHLILLESIDLTVQLRGHRVQIRAAVEANWKTGVEMEALTAVAVAALTVYDMGKALDRAIRIDSVQLLEKTGGTRGNYRLRKGKKP